MTNEQLKADNQRLRGLILKALDVWWPFVHGTNASNTAFNLRKELSDGIQPGAADRACRQVANKAEVDLSSLKRYYRSNTSMEHTRKSGGWVKFKDVRELLATPPATTGASTAPRPTDDELWDATLRDRDAYHEWADKLADAIAKHFGVDIGDHSNQNLPWAEALEAIENAEPVGASTVLTDERIDQLARTANLDGSMLVGERSDYWRSFARAIAREVAAAHFVCCPEDYGVIAGVPEDELVKLLGGTHYMDEPDGGSPTLLEQLKRMAEDAANYRGLCK